VTGRYDRLLAELRAGIAGVAAEPAAAAFLEKVRREAWTIGDADLAALAAAGLDDERIYELTVAAAGEEGLRRIDAGLRALRERR
jgi:alkylhydroperoxidase family enzyme